MIGIYKITNPKGKIYIGQSINTDRRFNEYLKLQCSDSTKLYNSLKKYSWDKHHKEVIEECSVELLNEREEYYILFYNSHIDGLNIKLGSKPSWTGKKRPEHSEWLKKNGSGLSYERTEEHKNHIKTLMTGKKFSKETCEKISQNKKGKRLKKVICNETNIIYNSLTECSEKTGISIGCICSFLKGKYPYPKLRGFTFSYC
jgi:group I intron endonuclease